MSNWKENEGSQERTEKNKNIRQWQQHMVNSDMWNWQVGMTCYVYDMTHETWDMTQKIEAKYKISFVPNVFIFYKCCMVLYTKHIDLTLFMLAFTQLKLCHVSKRLRRIAVKWWQQVISESYRFTIFTNCHFHNYLYTIRSFHFTFVSVDNIGRDIIVSHLRQPSSLLAHEQYIVLFLRPFTNRKTKLSDCWLICKATSRCSFASGDFHTDDWRLI